MKQDEFYTFVFIFLTVGFQLISSFHLYFFTTHLSLQKMSFNLCSCIFVVEYEILG